MARKRRKRNEESEVFFGESAGPPDPTKLTPVDVQQKVFRLAFRGYREADVDEFLDQVTETLAGLHEENKRLRESVESGTGGAPTTEAAERQAADIVRQAREHAARLVEEAEGRAGVQDAAPAPTSFLVRERAFLQELATLVQNHARSLKEAARRPKEPAAATATSPTERPEGEDGPAPAGAAPEGAMDEVTLVPEEGPGQRPERGLAPPEGEDRRAGSGGALGAAGPAALTAPPLTRTAPEEPPEAAPSSPPEPPASPTPARAFSAEEVPGRQEEDAPTVPWRPAESESPDDAGWSVEGSGEEGDPLLSAWESAFLARPEDEDRPTDEPGGEPPEPRPEPSDRDSQEPSLRELFWGEE